MTKTALHRRFDRLDRSKDDVLTRTTSGGDDVRVPD
jgi:hypothetical protein